MITSQFQIEKMGGLWRLGVCPEGQRVAFVAGGIYIVDVEQLILLGRLPEYTNANCLLFDSEGANLVVAGGSDEDLFGSHIRIYNSQTFKKQYAWEAHERQVRMVRFSRDHRLIVSAGVDSTVKIWDADNWRYVAGFFEHTRNVQDAVFSPCGEYIVSGGLEGVCWAWRVADQKPMSVFRGHLEEEHEKAKRSRVACVGVSPDGALAVSGSYGGTIRVWEPTTGEPVSSIARPEYNGVNYLSFTPDGKTLIALHTNGQISFINTNTWEEAPIIQAHSKRTLGFSMTPNGETMVTGSWDNTIKIWDVPTKKLRAVIDLVPK